MRLWILGLSASALCVAYLLGRVMSVVAVHSEPIHILPDHRPLSTTVVLQSWDNGMLRGAMLGSGRLLVGNRAVVINGSGAFAVRLELPKAAPAQGAATGYGGGFVASSRGKKYYPARSPAAEKLSPKYLRHFATKAEAEAAGYTPP